MHQMVIKPLTKSEVFGFILTQLFQTARLLQVDALQLEILACLIKKNTGRS